MKRVWALSLTTITAAVMSGCASGPDLAPVLPMPELPAEQRELIDVQLSFNTGRDLSENVVQLPSHPVRRGSSIVINVPSSLSEAGAASGDKNKDFKTKDFFNEAEQQIEKVFIGNNFRVISRSKFEAKLRDLRDAARCDLSQYHCLRDQVAPEVRPILEDLKAKFDAGKIDGPEYARQIALFKDKMQTASAGRSRAENQRELTDISEVIRAAQAGDIQADYILQINVFDTNKAVRVSADLRQEAKVRTFIASHPGLQTALESGRSQVSCAIVGAELNAKLIHVKSGEIVWIGSHELNEYSSGVQHIGVELGRRTFVANAQEIEKFVNQQNTFAARQWRYGRSVQVPAPVMRTALIGPIVSSGRCEKEWKADDQVRSQLARKVAYDLISTIRSGV